MTSMGKTMMYGSAALFAAGVVGWEMSRRRAISDMRTAFDEPDYDPSHISEGDVWRSVSEDIEPTLLDNPDGVIEFQNERQDRIGTPSPLD